MALPNTKLSLRWYVFKINWTYKYRFKVIRAINTLLNLAIIISFLLIGQFLDSEFHISDLINPPHFPY